MTDQAISAPRLLAQAARVESRDPDQAADLYRQVFLAFPANRRARDGLHRLRQKALAAPPPLAKRLKPLVAALKAGQAPGDVAAQAAALRAAAPHLATLRLECQAHQAAGDLQAMLAAALAGSDRWPQHALVWQLCATALNRLQRRPEALRCWQMVIRLAPDLAVGHCGRARILLETSRPAEALAALDQGQAVEPDHGDILPVRAEALRALGRDAEAEAAFQALLQRDPQNWAAHDALGVIALAHGRDDAARDHFGTALTIAPENGLVNLHHAQMLRFTDESPDLARLQALAEPGRLPPDQSAPVQFALFRALDQLGRTDQAFAALARGNDLRRAVLAYDPASDAAQLRQLMQLRVPRLADGPAEGQARPVFITGLPRSGTTLTERMLGRLSGVHAAGELPLVAQAVSDMLQQLRLAGQIEPDHLAGFARQVRAGLAEQAQEQPVVLDKMPANFRFIDLILSALPEARVIHMQRDPMAVGWSLYRHYFTAPGNGFVYGLDSIAAYIRLHDEMMLDWHRRWPGRILTVDYARLTEAPEVESRRLAAFCGLDWQDSCLSPQDHGGAIYTLSSRQVRAGIYRGSDQDWRRYACHLAPLQQMLSCAAA